MCTAVVWPLTPETGDPAGYLLAFNRDELLSRPEAEPPKRRGHFLAPIDPEGGGTWIAVNQHGLTVAALNVYQAAAQEPQPPIRSRGLLVTDLAQFKTLQEIRDHLQPGMLAHTRPVHLLVVTADRHALDIRWDGRELTLTPSLLPILRVSAALDAQAVSTARHLEFQQLQNDLYHSIHKQAALKTWFSSHALNGSPRGTCMHREPLAATVSHTQVRVTPLEVVMDYWAGSPCQERPHFTAHLARV